MARDYPVGIPVRPPPGWRPRTPPAHRPPSAFAPVYWAALISLMLLACMAVGWVLAQPRRGPAGPSRRDGPGGSTGFSPVKEEKADPHSSPSPKPKEEPPRPGLTYERHVLPAMERACVSCHGERKKRGGLDLRTLAALRRGGENGPGVVAGRPDESPLWESVVTGRMPPGKPNALSAGERKTIRDWIASGAKGER